jgi:predicted anti-sigma-YlaC factor YlaD
MAEFGTDGTGSGGQLCDRAREWSSLLLDGELSELEQALLDAHLARCAGCRTFALVTEAHTLELRTTEPEQLTSPIALPRRATGGLRSLQTGVAAAMVIAAAALGSALGVLEHTRSSVSATTRPIAVSMIAFEDSPDTMRALRRGALIHQSRSSIQRSLRIPGDSV